MAEMSSFSREVVLLIMQFLGEENLKDTIHKLEQESGCFFNMEYFQENVRAANWDEVERYLSGFTRVDDNRFSTKLFFEIRKQKYLEALDKSDRAKAVDILVKDLKVFASFNADVFKEITQLLTLENFRHNEQLSVYRDMVTAREVLVVELKKLIEANPLFNNKLQFPILKSSRLRTLLNQSLNWQHELCKNPRSNPDIRTLLIDHSCDHLNQLNDAHALSPAYNPLLGFMPRAGGFSPLGAHGPAPAPSPVPMAGWMSNPPTVTYPAASGELSAPMNSAAAMSKHPWTPPTIKPTIDYLSVKRTGPIGLSDEVNLPVNVLPTSGYQNHSRATRLLEELPKNVARTFNQVLSPMSMDFHPIKMTFLLVGTNAGDVELWDVASRKRLFLTNFKVWNIEACSMTVQAALDKDPAVSVNRVKWSPDGSLFGVAYSRYIVHIYSYHNGMDVRQHLEIDAHIGGVNDLAFAQPNEKLFVITCGDDKTIKVWDASYGTKQYTLEGHEEPVYSVCPVYKENIQFILSTALDGKIKAWLYDNKGAKVDYDAPGKWCTTMAYSADGTRLFSCGTSKDGESYIVEWNESDGAVKRTYQGLSKRLHGVVQFDTTRNQILAAGDEFLVKFWDMDNANLLAAVDTNGRLPVNPRIRFNKAGTLLAVSTYDDGIKILANADGLQLLRALENHSFDSSRPTSEAVTKNGDTRNLVDVNPRLVDESMDKSKISNCTEINEPVQCRSLRLVDNLRTSKISRLMYTNSGLTILALASNGIHLLWKWPHNELISSGKVVESVPPQLWQPSSGKLMTNDITDVNPEEVIPCFALSKNDSYLMSASGGRISLFNMLTFKTMATFMPPPPAASVLAFHPHDNNIVAIGMNDCTIQIFNVQLDQVTNELRGHSKRVTGFAFANAALNVLVSSGADAQLIVWGTDGWKKKRSRFLQIPPGHSSTSFPDTHVQFHQYQMHILVVHRTQIAIYETTKLECVKQWVPRKSSSPISHATFSCDSQSIYVSFVNATVCIFDSLNLTLQCQINPAAYLPSNVSSNVYPLVVAAHPTKSSQFALGLTDGEVVVLEPLESGKKWGAGPSAGNGSASSMSTTTLQGASSSVEVIE